MSERAAQLAAWCLEQAREHERGAFPVRYLPQDGYSQAVLDNVQLTAADNLREIARLLLGQLPEVP